MNSTSTRPKLEAISRSRFSKTIILDADLFVLADISDIFDLLDHFDIALAHDQYRNSSAATTMLDENIPAAFPQFNAGVIAIRKNEQTDNLVKDWEILFNDSGSAKDQPALRQVLYKSDLRIATLPPEYNLMEISKLRSWTHLDSAPRIIHHFYLHSHISADKPMIKSTRELLGRNLDIHIKKLAKADVQLSQNPSGEKLPAFSDLHYASRISSPYDETNFARLLEWIKKILSPKG